MPSVQQAKPPVKLSDNAMRVLKARYLRRDSGGQVVETPRQMFERVARVVSEAELDYGPASQSRIWEERFFQLMSSLDFLPNSPTLMNAGAHWASSLPVSFSLWRIAWSLSLRRSAKWP